MKSVVAFMIPMFLWTFATRAAEFETLADLAAKTRTELNAANLPDLDDSEQAMRQSIAAVDSYLRRTATAEIRTGWLDYLLITELQEALASGDRERIHDLGERIESRLSATYPGLERGPVMEFRSSAARLSDAAQFGRDSVLPAIERQLNQLEQLFREMEPVPSALNAAGAARIVTILNRSGLAAELVDAAQKRFDEPNFRLHVSDALVSDAVGRPIYQQQPVSQVLLGTPIRGSSTLDGHISAELVPNDQRAAIRIFLSGQFSSQTTGFNRKVRIYSQSHAALTASSTIRFDQTGTTRLPSSVTGEIDSTLCGVSHPLKLVRRIARRRAAEQQPLAEQIGTRRLHRQIADSFDDQLDEALGNKGEEALDRSRTFFDRLGLPRPQQRWWTDRQFIHLYAVQRGPGQLAAVTAPPLPDGDRYLTLQLHESAVDNAGASVLAGRTLNGTQLRDMLVAAGISADALQPQRDAEGNETEQEIEITFADFRPVVFEAREKGIRIGLRGTRFSDGEREIERPLEIAAQYRIEEDGGFAILERQGEIEVNFPGLRRLGVTEIAIKQSILRSFDVVFPPSLFEEPLDLSQRFDNNRQLQAEAIGAADGWLTIHLR